MFHTYEIIMMHPGANKSIDQNMQTKNDFDILDV